MKSIGVVRAKTSHRRQVTHGGRDQQKSPSTGGARAGPKREEGRGGGERHGQRSEVAQTRKGGLREGKAAKRESPQGVVIIFWGRTEDRVKDVIEDRKPSGQKG